MIKIKNIKVASEIADACIGCKKCMKNCPMLSTYCKSPTTLFKEIKKTEEVDRKLVFSCTGCDYCSHVCPRNLDIKKFCYEIKTQCVEEDALLNKAGHFNVINFHKASIHPIFTYLGKEIKRGDTDTVFMPGCSLASTYPDLIKQIVRKMNGISPVALFVDCCGNPVYGIGDQKRFNDNVERIMTMFKKSGIKKVVTACGNCHKVFSSSYDVEVVDLWQYMNDYSDYFIKDSAEAAEAFKSAPVMLHDPCSFRKNNKTHEAVRALVTKMGVAVEEFKQTKDQSPCCGAGGMMEIMMPHQAKSGQESRVKEAENRPILSYCQCCVEGFSKQGNSGIHILELIFQREAKGSKRVTILQRWINRWIVSNIIK